MTSKRSQKPGQHLVRADEGGALSPPMWEPHPYSTYFTFVYALAHVETPVDSARCKHE